MSGLNHDQSNEKAETAMMEGMQLMKKSSFLGTKYIFGISGRHKHVFLWNESQFFAALILSSSSDNFVNHKATDVEAKVRSKQ